MSLPYTRWRELNLNLELTLQPEDHLQANGFLHFCHEWDGLLIERGTPEFDCCSCRFQYPDFDPFTGKAVLLALPAPIRG